MMCQSTWSKGKEAKAVKEVTLFTDGSCLGNPGPGGWACILRYGKHERILRGVALRTTNNRMELEAAINGLLVLTERCSVTVITDSKYLQQGDHGVPGALAKPPLAQQPRRSHCKSGPLGTAGIGVRTARNEMAVGPRPRI